MGSGDDSPDSGRAFGHHREYYPQAEYTLFEEFLAELLGLDLVTDDNRGNRGF